MRSLFAGMIMLSASIAVVGAAQARKHPQRPPAYGYVQTPIGHQQPTNDDLKAIEKDNEQNDLPASHDTITGGNGAGLARDGVVLAQTDHTLHIDVPVKLAKANIVFDGALVPEASGGNAAVGHSDRRHWFTRHWLSDWNVQGHVISVFHGDAAYLLLNDDSYNANRHVQTGNPYGKLIAGLMKQGVQIELCGATAETNHWTNADFLPGVKVDTNAMVRVTQLEQDGFILIYE
jgi:intracellular sulfur oxidation DsrE/DsrF family protein